MLLACVLTFTMIPQTALAAGNANADAVQRVFGSDRYETSLRIADVVKDKTNATKFNSVIVASGSNFPDALAGSYLAAVTGAPIILTSNKRSVDMDWFSANVANDANIYILGGISVVSDVIESQLNGYHIERLAGENRYETNLIILQKAMALGGSTEDILVCTGKNFADSLSASATGKAILLVNKNLTTEQKDFLNSSDCENIYIIGGTSAVATNIERELFAYGSVERISGSDRYETSVKIAEVFFTDADCAVLAYAKNFPDGLCGGPLAFAMNAPLILTASGKETDAISFAEEVGIYSGIVLGGEGLISENSAKLIFGTNCSHDWYHATCTTPKKCKICGVTEGKANGHWWEEAACTYGKYCIVCMEEDPNSKPLGHSYVEGVCKRCGEFDLDYDKPIITADTTSLYLDRDSDVVYISMSGADAVIYEVNNTSVVTCEWGEWDGYTIPLTFHPVSNGQTTVTVYTEGYEKSITIRVYVEMSEPTLTVTGVGEEYCLYYPYKLEADVFYLHSAKPEITVYSFSDDMYVEVEVVAEIVENNNLDSNYIGIEYELIDEEGICVDTGHVFISANYLNKKYSQVLTFWVDIGDYTLTFKDMYM